MSETGLGDGVAAMWAGGNTAIGDAAATGDLPALGEETA